MSEPIVPYEDVVELLKQQTLTWWEERTGLSRKHLRLIRRGERQIAPYEWARLVLAAIYPARSLQIAQAPLENSQGFEEERYARVLTKGAWGALLGMSKTGYTNASLGYKNFGNQPQKALAWIRAGYDWRDYATLRYSDVRKRQEQSNG